MNVISCAAKILGFTAAAGVLTISVAATAGANPGDDPCAYTSVFFCRMLPIAPDLEGDVDLTVQQPSADPDAPIPVAVPPTVDMAGQG